MDKLMPLIEKLANILGQSIEYTMDLLAKQVVVEIQFYTIWLWVIGGILGIITAVCILMFSMGIILDEKEVSAMSTVVWVPCVLIFGALWIHLYYQLQTLLVNPEYWVLKELLEQTIK